MIGEFGLMVIIGTVLHTPSGVDHQTRNSTSELTYLRLGMGDRISDSPTNNPVYATCVCSYSVIE